MLLLPRNDTSTGDPDDILVPNPDLRPIGPATVGVTWALTAVCVIMVAARFYVRSKVKNAIGSDDWIMLSALVFRIGAQATCQKMYDWGLGNGEQTLTYKEENHIMMYYFLQVLISMPVAILARLSVTILLVRIFDRPLWLRWYLIVFTTIMTIVGVMALIVGCVQCVPLRAYWDAELRQAGAWCMELKYFQYIAYLAMAFWTFSDITYVLFPVIVIWRLNMPLSQRVALTAAMTLSLLTAAACIVRAIASQVLTTGVVPGTWWGSPSSNIMSSNSEQCAVIILGSVPPLVCVFKAGAGHLRKAVKSLGRSIRRRMFGRGQDDWKSPDHSPDQSPMLEQRKGRAARHRMDIWRTDSYSVTYETHGPQKISNV
ncbi:hypothetical protein GGR52DRAFT_170200 [Hypoxylon sp. FL1284]|nr:hypothetical protein GGR52DRAFT_170200 [Hypoxylon sp. FL1284]